MLSWTLRNAPSSTRPRILDLGCGNGHFLFLLSSRRGGYRGADLTGVDYSQGSVELARLIGAEKSEKDDDESEESSEEEEEEEEGEGEVEREGTEKDVQFERWDMLGEEALVGGPWDLV